MIKLLIIYFLGFSKIYYEVFSECKVNNIGYSVSIYTVYYIDTLLVLIFSYE